MATNVREFPGYGTMNVVDLSKLSMEQLVELHNTIKPDAPVTEFGNKAKANAAVWLLGNPVEGDASNNDTNNSEEGDNDMAKDKATKAEKTEKAAKEPKKVREPRQPKEWEDLPEGKEQQLPRPGSVLAITLDLIKEKRGATLEEIQTAIGEKHVAMRLLRWANKERGFGFTKTASSGKIQVQASNIKVPVVKEPKPPKEPKVKEAKEAKGKVAKAD